MEGKLTHEVSRGDLFSLLATALRNDIIDALRKAAHMREENRPSLPRKRDSSDDPPSLDELPNNTTHFFVVLEEEDYCQRVRASLDGEPELSEMTRVILELNINKPRELAAALGISAAEVQNRKKRLRRRFIEHNLVKRINLCLTIRNAIPSEKKRLASRFSRTGCWVLRTKSRLRKLRASCAPRRSTPSRSKRSFIADSMP